MLTVDRVGRTCGLGTESIDRGVLAEAIRATPFAWLVLGPADDVLFASGRAEAFGSSSVLWPTVKELVGRARRDSGSAAADVAVPGDDHDRLVRVEARRLGGSDAPATVVWIVELDGERADGLDARLEVELALGAVDDSRARIDELVGDLARRTEERERLAGLVDAMVHGLDAGVVVVDRAMVVDDCSERAVRLMGTSRSELVGRPLASMSDHVGPELAQLVEPCVTSGRSTHGVVPGPSGPLLVGCSPYEATTRAVVVLQDLHRLEARGAEKASPAKTGRASAGSPRSGRSPER